MRVQMTDTWQKIVNGQALVVVSVIDGPIQYADSAGAPETNTVIQNVTLDANLEVDFGCWMRCPIPGVTGVVDITIDAWEGVGITSPDGTIEFGRAMTQAEYDAIPTPGEKTLYAIYEEP